MPGRRDKWTGEDESYQHVAGDLDPGPMTPMERFKAIGRTVMGSDKAPSVEVLPDVYTGDKFTKGPKGIENATKKRADAAIRNIREQDRENSKE